VEKPMSATGGKEGMRFVIVKIAVVVVREGLVAVAENEEVAEAVEGDSPNYQIFKLN
jgi:hypothetical protein